MTNFNILGTRSNIIKSFKKKKSQAKIKVNNKISARLLIKIEIKKTIIETTN